MLLKGALISLCLLNAREIDTGIAFTLTEGSTDSSALHHAGDVSCGRKGEFRASSQTEWVAVVFSA